MQKKRELRRERNVRRVDGEERKDCGAIWEWRKDLHDCADCAVEEGGLVEGENWRDTGRGMTVGEGIFGGM